jgi:hypothetical protein
MKVMTPVLTKAQEDRQLIDDLKTVISEESNEDVAASDGDVTIDISGITYHEGQYHITRQPGLLLTDVMQQLHRYSALKDLELDYIELYCTSTF